MGCYQPFGYQDDGRQVASCWFDEILVCVCVCVYPGHTGARVVSRDQVRTQVGRSVLCPPLSIFLVIEGIYVAVYCPYLKGFMTRSVLIK